MNPLYPPWIAEVVLITYRAQKKGQNAGQPIKGLPMPSYYMATFIVFGALALLPGAAQRPATIFGYGIVVATLLNLWDPSSVGTKAQNPAQRQSKIAAGK